ncbi:MAG: non-homologous end-joining DNA ligase [Alphaproteobacteria bacterium]|nr:non-homologous end-joining DNA ligase [Alphaproteobacteria bacterium]MBV9371071.1 non-homologous end-joining DNA ligase [Alphaproteobacteria bacterium]MBV9901555.1 non-homologous end-joining DNA ligase [Alphaproteobacteria bacterium]
MSGERIVAGVRLSSPDKILYPEQGITKGDLADYYIAVADRILSHVAFRPVTMVRCPTGRGTKCFYQRHAGSGVPEQLGEVTIPGFDEPYLFIRDLPGLVAMVQMGVLEIHPWGVTVDRPDKADRIIFDLDPDEGLAFADVIRAAREVRERLAALGLESFVKTTGGKGLHVVVPVEPTAAWREVKSFAKGVSAQMAADSPDRYLTKVSKADRAGRIFIDYLRNDPTSTAVAPYSTRSRAGAPVAMPLAWGQVKAGLDPCDYTVRTVPALIRRQRIDPWSAISAVRQTLPDAPRA